MQTTADSWKACMPVFACHKQNYFATHLKVSAQLGDDLLERSSVVKDLGVLMASTLPMSQQCAPVAKKASGILGCIANRVREVVLPSALLRPNLKFCVVLGASVHKKQGCPRKSPAGGHKDLQGLKHPCMMYEERLRLLGLFSLGKRQLRLGGGEAENL